MARYDITGIGINLREIPDDSGEMKLKVLGLILDGPAHSAGVRQGDELLSINGVDVKESLHLKLHHYYKDQVKHGNCGAAQSITVRRQPIAKSPVFYRLENVKDGPALRKLQDMGASCFVLDLRDNLGGLVQAGIEVAKLFLNEGETLVKNIVAESSPLFTAPIIVLVNKNTASASEIVSI